ncbi:MAG: hypothetical protein WC518_00170 [Patescibacteria group bacterium]
MKYVRMISILAVTITLPVWAEEAAKAPTQNLPEQLRLIPPVQLDDDWTWTTWGWTSGVIKLQDNATDAVWQMTRINTKLQGRQMAFGLVLELADLQEDTSGNWLREAWLETPIGFDGRLKLRGGLFTLACGFGNPIIGPFKWDLPFFPASIPFSSYAPGVQLRWESDVWTALWDVTGRSGEAFDSSKLFDRLESSFMLKRKLDQGCLGITGQVCDDFLKLGGFLEWRPKPWFCRVEVDGSNYSDDHISNQVGGYLLLGRELFDGQAKLSGIAMYNRQLPKYWTEIVTSVGKNGQVTSAEVARNSPDKTDTSIGATAEVFLYRDIVSVKAGYYWSLEPKTPDQGQLQFLLRF